MLSSSEIILCVIKKSIIHQRLNPSAKKALTLPGEKFQFFISNIDLRADFFL